MNDLIFVYGTLRPEFDGKMSHWFSQFSEHYSRAFYNGKLFMIKGYPGVIPSDNPNDRVVGDLCRMVDPALSLRNLDYYEGCGNEFKQPTEYLRTETTITKEDGSSVSAWIYLYNLPVKSYLEIESGDFLADFLGK